jgi:hypothetical protein
VADEDVKAGAVRITLPSGTRITVSEDQAHLYRTAEQAGPDPSVDVDLEDEAPAAFGPPPKSADKAAWVKWAVEQHGARFGEAKAMTKASLIEQYGTPAPAQDGEGDTPNPDEADDPGEE